MSIPIANLRHDYAKSRLEESGVAPDPIVEFTRWFEEALKAEVQEPNAMTLATATADGAPSARIVLLKGFDERGFVFFTDYRSRKAGELKENARAALVFYWPELERQIRITGSTAETDREESETYFRSRPRGSRIGAWVSHQSQVVGNRAELEQRIQEVERRYPGDDIPLPPYWGGFRLRPESLEFWQGRTNRLHDRIRYLRMGTAWRIERLSP
jgi:pyridoxamine 5'-phosphate oxidase